MERVASYFTFSARLFSLTVQRRRRKKGDRTHPREHHVERRIPAGLALPSEVADALGNESPSVGFAAAIEVTTRDRGANRPVGLRDLLGRVSRMRTPASRAVNKSVLRSMKPREARIAP